MKRNLSAVVVLCAALLSACDTGPNLREYPGLFDLPAATVAEVNTTAPVPGRYNVRATVIEVNACSCPPNADCTPCPPDGVLLSASGAARPPGGIEGDPNFLYVEAEDPEQFEAGQRYALSVEVEAAELLPSNRLAQLLGYEREN